MDIPYTFNVDGCQVTGVVHLTDKIENTSTDGVVVGPVLGNYNLNGAGFQADLLDPTRELLRLIIQIDVNLRFVQGRFDTRRFDGKWNEGGWVRFQY